MQNHYIFVWLGHNNFSEYLQMNKFLVKIQVLQEMKSANAEMFEWQAAEPLPAVGSQTVKCAVCEHTSPLWLTSLLTSNTGPQHCHVWAGMCPQQQSGALHCLLKVSFTLHMREYTPSNTIYTWGKLQGK